MAKHPVTALILAVCFLLCPFGANGDIADIVRKHDRGTREERALVLMLLLGTEAGFAAANAELKDKCGETPLYCPPEAFQFSGEQLFDLVRRWVDANRSQVPSIDAAPMHSALLYALEDAFPCSK